jgi:hypothetical protein
MDRARRERRWSRFLLEYVGNLDVDEPEPDVPAAPVERRSNHRAREQMDWFKQEMAGRHLSPEKENELLDGLREAIRHGEAVGAGPELAEEVDRE